MRFGIAVDNWKKSPKFRDAPTELPFLDGRRLHGAFRPLFFWPCDLRRRLMDMGHARAESALKNASTFASSSVTSPRFSFVP